MRLLPTSRHQRHPANPTLPDLWRIGRSALYRQLRGNPVKDVRTFFKAPQVLGVPSRGINQMSKKRRSQQALRRQVVAEVLYRDGRCRAFGLLPGRCSTGHLDVHEIIPRSAWADGYLVAANCVAVCRSHHSYIDDHPARAHDFGLHGYAWERPA